MNVPEYVISRFPVFDRDFLEMCLYRCALDLGQDRYITRLQFDVPVMSVASFYDEPIVSECSHECTIIENMRISRLRSRFARDVSIQMCSRSRTR